MGVCNVLSKEIVEGYFLTFEIEEIFFKEKKTLFKVYEWPFKIFVHKSKPDALVKLWVFHINHNIINDLS